MRYSDFDCMKQRSKFDKKSVISEQNKESTKPNISKYNFCLPFDDRNY
jgi:hypothetical protein